jgi:hypothetical protein
MTNQAKPLSSNVLARSERRRGFAALGSVIAASMLAACGGGGGGSASIGGTVTGLTNGRTLVMQNNAADDFSIVGNGATSFTFAFSKGVGAGDAYNVSVLTQPLGQTCAVTKGSGSVNSNADSVTTVAVACTTTSSVVGTVSGLQAGVAVTLNSNGTTVLAGNGPFTFAGILPAGSTYTVTVATQPLGQTCAIANASGTVVANTSAQVTVTCN